MYVFLWLCACMFDQMSLHMYVGARGQQGRFLNHSPPYILSQGLSLNLEFPFSAILAGQ